MALGQPYNFLWLVNRLCHKLNEVELNSTTFANATGVYTDFQESVNAAILDIYQEEDNQWPFCLTSTTLTTIPGINTYTAPAGSTFIDWDSFYIQRPVLTINTLTQINGLATATVTAGHQLMNNDNVVIQDAADTNYNGTFNVTVLNSTQFTFGVAAIAVSPDTSTTAQMVAPITTRKLPWVDYDSYREEGYLNTDGEAYAIGNYGLPNVVVRRKDNNIMLSPKPDRIYTIPFDYFTEPADLVNYNDVPTIPSQFKQVIVDGAMYHAYMFRDNEEEAQGALTKYEAGVNRMRRILIPQQYYMRVDASVGPGSALNSSSTYSW